METISREKPKAKKEHYCNFCNEPIEKGDVYDKQTNKCDGELYVWKTHQKCSDIASKLKMYDNCDEGLTQDDFVEHIKCKYDHIMFNHFNEQYESKDFVIPKFKEQLKFVIQYYSK